MKKLLQAVVSVFVLLGCVVCVSPVIAEDSPELLADQQLQQQQSVSFLQAEFDAQLSQVRSEVRSQRDLAELRLSVLENKIENSSLYVERLLFAFVVAGAIVTFVVLTTLNKQTGINNEKMRNLIRESERALGDLHRILDRPEAEHFHVSRKLTGVMNKMRQNANVHLTQKEMRDIYASADDPTLPVALHLQANALKQEQSGDFRGAIQIWDQLLAIDDSNVEIYLHLAQNFKQLAETSNDGKGNDYRKASLDFFHEYAVRTNQHMQAEQEVRRHLQLKQDNRKRGPVDIRASGSTHSLSNNAITGVSSLIKPQTNEEPKATSPASFPSLPTIIRKPLTETAAQALSSSGKPDELANPETTTSKPAVIKQDDAVTIARKSPDIISEHKGNGAIAAKPTGIEKHKPSKVAPPARRKERKDSSKQIAVKTASAAPKKPVRLKIHASKSALTAQKPNGASKDKPLDPEQIKLAYKSRMAKADECFDRFMNAKPKEQKAWLEAALSEFAIAEQYCKEEKLYRLWGIALLEMLKSKWGDSSELLQQATEKFEQGIALSDGELNNELALCHALNQDEEACRTALEQAHKLGKLNAAIYMEQPEFEVYKAKDWFKQLAMPLT